MNKYIRPLTFSLAAALALSAPTAGAIIIDNGVVGDGAWEVDVLDGGESRDGTLDPVGLIPDELIFDYFHFVDVGADGGGVRLGLTTVTTPAFSSGPNEVTSAGTFLGENGAIEWTAVSSIAPGSTLYLSELSFTSSTPFGSVELIQYLDEDVFGSGDDNLIVLGTPGDDDFQLLTIDDDLDAGVSHSATYNTAIGMDYIGWAADEFSDLRSDITGGGASYSIAGVVDLVDMPANVDPRFPGDPAFGVSVDVTSAIAFLFDPDATSASVIFALGGSPEGAPTPPIVPVDPGPVVGAEPTSVGLFGVGLALLGFAVRRRRPI